MKKALFGIVAIMGLSLVAGCKGGGSAETGNGMVKNTQNVANLVDKELTSNPKLKGAKIKVTLDSGMLTLDGTVKDILQKDAAEKTAMDVQKKSGQQTGVNNNLIIEEPSSSK